MIILPSITDNVQILLDGTVSTSQLSCLSFWRDINLTGFTPGRTVSTTANTTGVNIVPAPVVSTQRVVDMLNVYNNDTSTKTATLKYDANGTGYIMWQGPLGSGESVQYVEGVGWTTRSNTGAAVVAGVHASSLLGTVLATNVVTSSLAAVGTLTSGSINWTGSITTTGAGSFGAISGTTGTFSNKITVTNANVRLSNAFFLSGNLVAGTEVSLIGRNASNQVSIDPDGYGSVFGGSVTGGAGSFTTGTFSSTVAIQAVSPILQLNATGDLDTTGTAYISLRDNSTGVFVERAYIGFGLGDGSVSIANLAGSINLRPNGGGTVATFTSTGLNNTVIGATTPAAISGTTGSFSSTLSQTSANPVIQAISTTLNNTAKFYLSDGTNVGQFMVSGGIGYLDFPTSLTLRDSNAGNATRATVASTGLSVTGTFGVSGAATFSSTTNTALMVGTSSSDANYRTRIDGGAGASLRTDTSADSTVVGFFRSNVNVGSISVTTTATAYNTSSALAKKCNFRALTTAQTGAFFDGAKPWLHDWKTGEKDSIGWGAEEIHANLLAAGLPAWGVTLAPDGGSVVDYSKTPDPITAAEIKSLRKRVADLEAKLAT